MNMYQAATTGFVMDVPGKTIGTLDLMDKQLDTLRTMAAALQADHSAFDATTQTALACTLLDTIDQLYAIRVHLEEAP